MATIIEDGTGTGYAAKVDATGRFAVEAVSKDEYNEATTRGESYIVNSGYITYTGDSTTSAVLFLKNIGDTDIALIRYNLSVKSVSSGVTEDYGRWVFYRNPSNMVSGTGTEINNNNLNFGSSNSLSIESEKGQNGASFNGGTAYGSPLSEIGKTTFIEAAILIPKGSSLGISFVTPPNNTSIQVAIGLNMYAVIED